MSVIIAQTPRLVLRAWREADKAPFAALNQDPRVMTFLGPPLPREASDRTVEAMTALSAAGQPAFWAVAREADGAFMGCIGVKRINFDAPFAPASGPPAYEIGWRLALEFWGQGFATEGAKAALRAAFHGWDMPEIFSFTVPKNIKSQAVMKNIGMSRITDGDFNHPKLALNDPLSDHVLYSITRGRE